MKHNLIGKWKKDMEGAVVIGFLWLNSIEDREPEAWVMPSLEVNLLKCGKGQKRIENAAETANGEYPSAYYMIYHASCQIVANSSSMQIQSPPTVI